MIYALASRRGAFGLGDHLKTDGAALAGIVEVLTYEDVFEHGSLPLGGYIFMGLDQLTPTERRLVERTHDELADSGYHVEDVPPVEGEKPAAAGPREFEAREPAAGLENAHQFFQGSGRLGNIPHAEGNGREIE